MDKQILFSILIPAYKISFLRQCLRSILNQSYNLFEIIILDDCSPYGIKGVIDEFRSDKIRYYRNEINCGALNVVDNWNKCLKYASGNYSICMGDDDELPSTALEEYVKQIKKYPTVDVFHAKTILINSEGENIDVVNTRKEYESCISFIRHRMDGDLQFVGDFCYRTEKLKEKGGYVKFPLAWCSDDVTAYMMSAKNGIVNLNAPSFYYRVNDFSISTTGNSLMKIKAIEKQRIWLRRFVQTLNYKDIQNQLSQKYVLRNIDTYLDKQKAGCISEDIRRNKQEIMFWLVNKAKYKITNKLFIYAILRAFK